jgi:carboxypeptidase C (cathepsin A)
MGLNPDMRKRISWATYEAGHMLYIDSPSHAKLHHDVAGFFDRAVPNSETP